MTLAMEHCVDTVTSEHLCDMDSCLAPALLILVESAHIRWGDEMLELWYSMLLFQMRKCL